VSRRAESDRFDWALETLSVNPGDRTLEIGRGHGVAVSLICAHLESGRITAIDRSRAMIERATERNREHVDSGKAVLEASRLLIGAP
jgi:ubiquinone/menaquinone biosynthesis C-methylase UbiE